MDKAFKSFMDSAPAYLSGVFFGDKYKYEKSMRWLYDVFGGWPGSREMNYLYDAIKILIAASMFNACSENGKYNDHALKAFNRYYKIENCGAAQAMADAACKFCDVDVLSYVTMEDLIIKRFHETVHPIDFKLTSCDWIGSYGFGGTIVLHLQEDREPLQKRYERYLPIAVKQNVLEDMEIRTCVKFITIADDAAGCSIFEMMSKEEKKTALLCSRLLTASLFNVGLARTIGTDVIYMLVCSSPGSMVDKWKNAVVYNTRYDMDRLEEYLSDN